ncbi:DEAD/DEAH box helicase [Microbacterium sp. GXF7504]
MPKNKKPAGGRPAKNFDPRYGAKTSFQDRKRRPGEASAGTTGSKSPKHRGYRADEGAAPKQRWSAQERAGRDEARSIRSRAGGERPARFEERAGSRPDGGHRGARAEGGSRGGRDERGARTWNDRSGAQRPARSYDERPARSYDERPARSYDDRPQRRSDDRPARSYDDRPQRSPRSYDDRAQRSPRSYDDRPQRRTDDRREAPRRFEERPAARHDDRRFEPRRDDRRGEQRPNRSDWNAKPRETAHEQQLDVVHERLQAQAVDAATVAEASFGELGLGENIVRALAELGADSPFPIQAATISPILAGRDVLARGRTGSGKTIAFGAPLVESILRSQAGVKRQFGRAPKALILAPTRELALQIDGTVQPIARSVGLFTTQVYGGVPQARQVGALKKGVDIVIGTPGRIEDLQAQGKLDLSEIRIVVLDEADHMSELGFLEPMQRLLRLIPSKAQKLLFSATLDREVSALVDEFLVDPAVYEVAGEDQDSGTIDHRVLVIDHRDKAELLNSLVDRDGKTLVFTRTRAYAEMLSEQFEDAGIPAVALHGDLNQAKRTRNLQRLTNGKVRVLVATDVAARGIHVDDIDLVVQADAPDEYKTYLHRSGRTGRAGREGTVVTLITRQRRRRMNELLDRAEISAPFQEARPGDDLLEELSGRQLADVTA